MPDGTALGFVVGLSDGIALGMSDGTALGIVVELSDGIALEMSDGIALGKAEEWYGDIVGLLPLFVGAYVG